MNRLKELRKEKKLTQEELASEIGVSKITILRWENGERQIKPDKAQKLADYFGVEVGYLLGYSEYRLLESALQKKSFKDPENVQDFAEDIATLLGLENTEKFFEYVNTQFLKEYEKSHVPPEIVKAHRDDFYAGMLFAPDEIRKIIVLWSVLTDEERLHVLKILEFLALKD
ncbi:TPA: helix-turn-helix domain-containing protein [Streptococcus suis]